MRSLKITLLVSEIIISLLENSVEETCVLLALAKADPCDHALPERLHPRRALSACREGRRGAGEGECSVDPAPAGGGAWAGGSPVLREGRVARQALASASCYLGSLCFHLFL